MSLRVLASLLLAVAVVALVWRGLDSGERHPRLTASSTAAPAAPASAAAAELAAALGADNASPREVVASDRTSEAPSPAAVPTGTLRGEVRDERDAPLTGCTVVVERENRTRDLVPERREVEATGGRFEVPGLGIGSWSVYAQRGDARSEVVSVHLPEAGADVRLVVAPHARLTGRVVTPSGQPAARARVFFTEGHWGAGDRVKSCDEDGTFALEDLQSGPFSLSARAPGFGPSVELMLDLAPGEERTELVLRLRVAAQILGELQDARGAPEPDIGLTVRGAMSSGGRTDGLGRFVIDELAPGDYELERSRPPLVLWRKSVSGTEDPDAAAPSPVPLELTLAEGETKHVVLGGPPPPSIIVRGLVLRGGRGCAARVSVANDADLPHEAQTDKDGRFTLRVARAGRLAFDVWCGNVITYFEREIPSERELVFELPGGEIVGRVTTPDGRPVARGWVTLHAQPDVQEQRLFLPSGQTSTDEAGAFRFLGIAAGRYRLEALDASRGAGAFAPVEQFLMLAEDERLEIELRLAPAAELAGLVRGPDGSVRAGIEVLAIGPDDRDRKTFTDATGRFTLAGLPPGPQLLIARGRELCSALHTVDVRAEEAHTLDLALFAGTRLRVEVVDADGAPLEAVVSLREARSGKRIALFDPVVSGSTSKFDTLLPSGDYEVDAFGRGFYPRTQPLRLVGQPEELVRIVPTLR